MINFEAAKPTLNHDPDLNITHGVGEYEVSIKHVAMKAPATREEVEYLLAQPVDSGDGRSEFVWVTLLNGDLMLACYPQGDTYEVLVNGEVG